MDLKPTTVVFVSLYTGHHCTTCVYLYHKHQLSLKNIRTGAEQELKQANCFFFVVV